MASERSNRRDLLALSLKNKINIQEITHQDNMTEHYINTFLETPRANVTGQTVSYCCFEKFRIKRYSNRPSLDYLLDLTKSTSHKIRKRKKQQIQMTS